MSSLFCAFKFTYHGANTFEKMTKRLTLSVYHIDCSGGSRGGSGGSLKPPPCPPFLNIR